MPTEVVGDNTGDDYAGTEDAQIYNANTTNNHGGAEDSYIIKYDASNHANMLLQFSGLSNISAPVTVSSATLYVYQNDHDGAGITATWYMVLRDWEEGTQDDADRTNDTPDSCCWDEYASSNGWTTAGALSDGNDKQAAGSAMTIGTAHEYKSSSAAQIATDVAYMINTLNYGWVGIRTDGADDTLVSTMTTSDGTDGQRPYISVTWTAAGGGSVGAIHHHYNTMRH